MNRKMKNRGFNLIELMVAMFIFLTCLMFIFAIFPASVKAVSQGRYTFLATEIAQQEMEYLKNMDWNKLENFQTWVQSTPDLFYRSTTLSCFINGVESSVTYNSVPVVTVFSTDSTGQADVVSIRVLVKYSHGSKVQKNEYFKSVELETLVAKPD